MKNDAPAWNPKLLTLKECSKRLTQVLSLLARFGEELNEPKGGLESSRQWVDRLSALVGEVVEGLGQPRKSSKRPTTLVFQRGRNCRAT